MTEKIRLLAVIISLLPVLNTDVASQSFHVDTLRVDLQTLIHSADSANESLLAFSHRLQADSSRILAANGTRLPQFSADADLSLLDIVPGTKTSFIGDGPADILVTGGVSQKIWDGGRTRALVRSLQASQGVETANRELFRQSMRLDLAYYYYRLCGLRRELEVIDENISVLDERIQFTGLLIDAGRMSEIERGRFEVARAHLTGKRLETLNRYESTSRSIALLIGVDGEVFYEPLDTLHTDDQAGVVQPSEVDELLQNAPTAIQQDALVQKAEAQMFKEKASFKPSIGARLWYGWEFFDAGFDFLRNDRWGAGVHARVPLFDGHSAKNRMAAVTSTVESVQLQRTAKIRELHSRVREQFDRLNVLRERIAIEQQASLQAEENLRLGIIEYEAGRRSNMDIIDMQNNVLQAQLGVTSLMVDYNITQSRIRSLAGEL